MLTRGIDHTPDEMSLDRDYDLADLVGFHIAIRLDNLHQRKSLIDTRLEIAYVSQSLYSTDTDIPGQVTNIPPLSTLEKLGSVIDS